MHLPPSTEMNDEALELTANYLAQQIADAVIQDRAPYSFHIEDYRAVRAEQRIRAARSETYHAGFRAGFTLARACA